MFDHNLMAHDVSSRLLQDIRMSRADWVGSYLTSKTTLWQGMADWPRPDIAFEDASVKASLAFEFKPPNQPKREYVTGLGQALTYLNDFTFSGLILPELANDGFKVADYISEMLSGILSGMPVALLSYQKDPTELNVLKGLQKRKDGPDSIPKGVGGKVFWGYWRDLSNYDLLTLLGLMDSRSLIFDQAFDLFWKKFAMTGKAMTWEGSFRKKKRANAPGKSGERLNVGLAVRHAGLVDSKGQITAKGYELMRIGKIYGADSTVFLEALAQQVLTVGRHLDLILWIDEQQRLISTRRKHGAPEFYRSLDLQLAKAGIISAPPTSAAKQHFLRDEPKLWRKLGLLVPFNEKQYFHLKHGLVFDWRKIISILKTS